jgi:hypothetical protein
MSLRSSGLRAEFVAISLAVQRLALLKQTPFAVIAALPKAVGAASFALLRSGFWGVAKW